jgi:hypothetical protein
MQYALIDNIRSIPEKGKTGICIGCGREVISKCGNIKVHHWAHKKSEDCDSWSEPETEWHREWKNKFPETYREVIFHDPKTNECHRADIHTNSGVTIEFQNSPISTQELKSREDFYSKLIWVVNGQKFKGTFTFDRNIPNPTDPLLANFEMQGMVYFKKEDILDSEEDFFPLYQVYGSNDPGLKDLKLSDIHFAFTWKSKHKVWFDSNASVFLDFGHDFLYWLRKRDQLIGPFWYVQVVKKEYFISKYSQ